MYPENILKVGAKFNKLIHGKSVRTKFNGLKASMNPTKIFYLWEKHGIKRIELFSME